MPSDPPNVVVVGGSNTNISKLSFVEVELSRLVSFGHLFHGIDRMGSPGFFLVAQTNSEY